jgi:hypothetical protein
MSLLVLSWQFNAYNYNSAAIMENQFVSFILFSFVCYMQSFVLCEHRTFLYIMIQLNLVSGSA